MPEITDITPAEVFAYREIYYEHVKPMIRGGVSQNEITECLDEIAPEYGITRQRYTELFLIDFIQRLSKLDCYRIYVKTFDKVLCIKELKVIHEPELKCPRRTEQNMKIKEFEA